MAYCIYQDIETLLSLEFTDTSIPTKTQVNNLIDQVSSEIDITLRQINVGSVSDPTILNYLRLVCSKGVACYVGSVYFSKMENTNGTISNSYCSMYKNDLKAIVDNPAMIGNIEGNNAEFSSNVTDGITEEENYTDWKY